MTTPAADFSFQTPLGGSTPGAYASKGQARAAAASLVNHQPISWSSSVITSANKYVLQAGNLGGSAVNPLLAASLRPNLDVKSLAVLVTDPDVADTTNNVDKVHWVMYDIPAYDFALATATTSASGMPTGTRYAANSVSSTWYSPPATTENHNLVFTLYQLDASALFSTSYTPSLGELVAAIKGHAVASSSFYARSVTPA